MQGRGGAGFPAGTKWGFLPPDVFPRYLVVNGDESEPGTYKDRLLMELDPHQLIEGVLIACYAINAAQAFLYVRGEMALAQERIAQALNDAYANNLVGRNILGTDFSVDIVLAWGAGAYIVGEETALIESLEGERGMPRLKPPYFPAGKGLYMQPTIVNNVETLANLPWIINESGQAFHDIGAPTSTGMRMFAISGHVNKPGVFEVPNGVTTFRMLFEAPEYCGGVREGRKREGVHPRRRRARCGSTTSTSTCRSTSRPSTRPARCSAPARSSSWTRRPTSSSACWNVVHFFARESCGKCTPCREGTTWLERILKRIISGNGRPEDLDLLMEVSETHQPRHRLAAAADDDLPARSVGGQPDRVGDQALPPRVRALHRARPPDRRHRARRRSTASPVTERGSMSETKPADDRASGNDPASRPPTPWSRRRPPRRRRRRRCRSRSTAARTRRSPASG